MILVAFILFVAVVIAAVMAPGKAPKVQGAPAPSFPLLDGAAD